MWCATGSTSASTVPGSMPSRIFSNAGGDDGRKPAQKTHEYLKLIRKEVDSVYPGKVLLAEANQWPEDVVEYFGWATNATCVSTSRSMPRMFMAVAA